MLRPVLLAILPLVVLCASALGLVRAAPQPDDALIAQVLNAGCEDVAGPCWYGIVPGVTRFQEAIDRLRQHPWIGAIDISDMPSPYVSWLWKRDAPAAIRGERAPAGGYAYAGYPDYHVVEGIHIWTALPQGDYWLALGRPEQAGNAAGMVGYTAGYPAQAGRDRVLAASYDDGTRVLHAGFPCEANARAFFSAPVALSIYLAPPRAVGDLGPGGLREWLYRAACEG